MEPDHDELVVWHKKYAVFIEQMEDINRDGWTSKSTLYVVEVRFPDGEWCPISGNSVHKMEVADKVKEVYRGLRDDLEFRVVPYDRREMQ